MVQPLFSFTSSPIPIKTFCKPRTDGLLLVRTGKVWYGRLHLRFKRLHFGTDSPTLGSNASTLSTDNSTLGPIGFTISTDGLQLVRMISNLVGTALALKIPLIRISKKQKRVLNK